MSSKPKNKKKPDWLTFEEITTNVYQLLFSKIPNATIRHNQKVYGRNTEKNRQIDVLIEQSLPGGGVMTIAISCKHFKSKLTIPKIDEFISVLDDINSNKGIIITKEGYSEHSKKYAKNKGIEICTLKSIKQKEWKNDLTIPAIRESRMPEFTLEIHGSIHEGLEDEINNLNGYFSKSLGPLKKLDLIISEMYNNNELNFIGESEHELEFSDFTRFHNGEHYPIDKLILRGCIKVSYSIKYLKPEDYFELLNINQNQLIIHMKVLTRDLMPYLEAGWKPLSDPEAIKSRYKGLWFHFIQNETIKPEQISLKHEFIHYRKTIN